MPPHPRAARRLLATSLAVSLLAALPWSAPASGDSPPEPPAAPGAPAPEGPVSGASITLLTGDRVVLGPVVDGMPKVSFHPRDPKSTSGFSVRRDGSDVFVIPHDVASLVPDVLARELFNVTGLAEMGYDDASTASLPLIVEHGGRARTLADATPLRVTGQLDSIGAAAVELDKSRASELGRTLASVDPARRSSTARATGGATKIWLDAKVTSSSLDGYLTQVGAPAAWDRGLDGTGVTLAVLDTGVDAAHPALAGQVLDQRSFTDMPSPADDNGHGTHVASLAVGTGAGSSGARQGIAPEAELLSGKVLDEQGEGQESWVIDGMEWAASQGADVVNLSLGGPPSGPGDPLVAALEHLTARHDILFAVAAGNRGGFSNNPFTIDSPGVAPSALTVAATAPDGSQADFSSEGPTGDYGLKPDLAAPGVNILGARAGARGENLYTSMSGTSMATPLVAGAAALLREQHPGWSAERVKATLMGTAESRHWWSAWKQGSGRLDLAAAVDAPISAGVANVDFGYLRHPDDDVRTRQISLTNHTDRDLTLRAEDVLVNGDFQEASAAAMTMQPETLTIPAGGSAATTLTVDPQLLEDLMWQGAVSFHAENREVLRVPVGLYDEPPAYDLHVSVLDRNGDPWDPATGQGEPNVDPTVMAFNADDGSWHRLRPDETGQVTARVPPGHYSIFARVVTPAGGGQPQTMTIAGTSEVLVESDTSYVVDARDGRPLELPTIAGEDVEVRPLAMTYRREATGQYPSGYVEGVVFDPEDIRAGRVFFTPTSPVTTGSFEVTARWRLVPTDAAGASRHHADLFELLAHEPRFSADLAPQLTRRDLGELARVEQVVHPVAREGEHLLVSGSATRETRAGFMLAEAVTPPLRRTVLTTASPHVLWNHCLKMSINFWRGYCGPARTYVAGGAGTVELGAAVHATPNQAIRAPGSMFVDMGWGDGYHVSNIANLELVDSGSLSLTLPDGEVQRSPAAFAYFEVPVEPVRLRLEHEWTLSERLHAAERSHTLWEFTSVPPDINQSTHTIPPLLEVEYGPEVAADGTVEPRGPLTFRLSFSRFRATDSESLRRISEAQMWWSADDGESWHPAQVHRRGPVSFRAKVTSPQRREGDDLSIRVSATDAEGNSIEQTNIGLLELGR